jgi:small subunit ribosomal protein S16
MVKIRLKRVGTKHKPAYRIVIADSRAPRDGRAIEEVGYYNPGYKGDPLYVNLERVDYWLKCGAQPTETVAALIKRARKLQTSTVQPTR